MSGNMPARDLVQKWTNTRRRLWSRWFNALENLQTPISGGILEAQYRKSLEIYEQMVRGANAELTRTSAGHQNDAYDLPAVDRGEVYRNQTEWWKQMQKQFWASWFQALKGFLAMRSGGPWNKAGEELLKSWEDIANHVLELQAELSPLLPPLNPEKKRTERLYRRRLPLRSGRLLMYRTGQARIARS